MSGENEAATDVVDILQSAAFKAIGEAHIANLIDEIEAASNEIQDVEISQSMMDWSEGFIAPKRTKRNKIKKINMSRAAIYFLIFLGVFSFTTLSVEGIRVKLFEYFIEVQEEFTRIYRTDEQSTLTDPELDLEHYYYPTMAPKGYIYKSHSAEGDIISMYYSNGKDEINFLQFETAGDWQLDTEDAEVTEVSINDDKGLLIVKGERSMLFWHNDRSEFLIRGYISGNEILKIAESLEEKK